MDTAAWRENIFDYLMQAGIDIMPMRRRKHPWSCSAYKITHTLRNVNCIKGGKLFENRDGASVSYGAYLTSTYVVAMCVTKSRHGSSFMPQFAYLTLGFDHIERELREDIQLHANPSIDEQLCRVDGLVRCLDAAKSKNMIQNKQDNNQVMATVEGVCQQHETNPPLLPPNHVTMDLAALMEDRTSTLKQAQKGKDIVNQKDKEKQRVLIRVLMLFADCMFSFNYTYPCAKQTAFSAVRAHHSGVGHHPRHVPLPLLHQELQEQNHQEQADARVPQRLGFLHAQQERLGKAAVRVPQPRYRAQSPRLRLDSQSR